MTVFRPAHPVRWLARCASAVVPVLLVAGALAPSATAAEHPSAKKGHSTAPGSVTGYAFDSCSAPPQAVMDAWWRESPYTAVGVYIGGTNRLCTQPELTPGWVRTQQQRGWRLLAVQVGPQASCSGYADRMSNDVTTAGQQGRAEAASAVATARGLGIGKGSTLYYDLEDYDLAPDDCRRAALSFLSGWTQGLHAAGYDSGVYSNIAAAITSLDLADRVSPGSYLMPDDIWFAWANGRADTTTDARVLSDRWDDHARIHQYAVDVTQTYGGYSLVVDANWADVGAGSVAPRHRALCKGVDVDLRRYPTLRPGKQGAAVRAAQCLLRRQHLTKAPITGRYDARTVAAVRTLQRKADLRPTGKLTRPAWTALLARGSRPLLKVGATGSSVERLQRALNAALRGRAGVDGVFSKRTERYLTSWQGRVGLPTTGVATKDVWERLTHR